MSLKTWLVLFILSMAFSTEVLAWAVRHGQFTQVNRGNVMPLRGGGANLAPPRKRRLGLWVFLLGLLMLAIVWGDGMITIARLAYS
ncbi:MAG TPA: hypothetical protein VIE13_05480 [Terriglobales bacterium]|jgi:hypothetical protein